LRFRIIDSRAQELTDRAFTDLGALDNRGLMQRAVPHIEVIQSLRRVGIIPDFEAVLESTYRRLIGTGDTVVDVGANQGRHTTVFAELVGSAGSVHAFEPLPDIFARLQAKGLPPHVKTYQFALGLDHGPAAFVHAKGTPAESGLKQRKSFNCPDLVTPEIITVEVRRLDDFADDIRDVRYIKMDIEGGEVDCLRGAMQLISRDRPYISAEYGGTTYEPYGHAVQTLFDQAESMGYMLGDLFGAVIGDIEAWERVCNRGMWDWYLIPRERIDEWTARLAEH
jgi:FkbM family methyltransferase